MLSKEKLVDEAKQQAKKFIDIRDEREKRVNSASQKTLSSSQLRKFFNEFKRLEMRLKSGQDYSLVEPLIALQVAQVNYAWARKKIPASFKNFIECEVKKIKDQDSFVEFMKFFEAIVGFYYYFAKEYKLKID
ncbi:MAG: type III-A CRISPR-associated protein Csm2 [Desulfonauticus sp.]|nr:type III-A CRISPR-associated protein Csm2 [Desulfonauticus sp.]